MRFPPPEVVATWPAPNYENPVVRRYYMIAVSITLIVVAAVMVGLRIYARFIHTRSGQLDDWLVVMALLPAIALTVTAGLLAERYGFNRHIWDFDRGINNVNLVKQRKFVWISSMLYHWSSSLTKLSLLWFYRRIFTVDPMRRILRYFTLFVLGFFLSFFGVLLFECQPLQFYWTASATPMPHGTCSNEVLSHLVAGILNVIIDAAILVLPLRTVFNLKINRHQKIQVASIFMAGILVVASSSARIATTARTVQSYDVTWYGYETWMWICIEVDVGIICASVPACKSLFKVWTEKLSTMQSLSLGSRNTPSSGLDNTAMNASRSRPRSNYVRMQEKDIRAEDHPANWRGEAKGTMSSSSNAWSGKDEEFDLEFLGDPRMVTEQQIRKSRRILAIGD